MVAMSAGIAGERHPAERPRPSQNSGRMYAGTKPGIIEGLVDAAARPGCEGCCRSRRPAPAPAIRPSPRRAPPWCHGTANESSGSVAAHLGGLSESFRSGHSHQRIVGAGLIGEDVGRKPRSHSSGRTSAQLPTRPTDSGLAAVRARLSCHRSSRRAGHLVEVARLDAARKRRVDIDASAAAVHRDGQRLRAAHPTEAGRDRERAGQRSAECCRAISAKHLIGALRIPWVPM